MIPDGTDADAVTKGQIQQVAADVEHFAQKHNIKRKAIARAIGYIEGVITDFLNGKYKGKEGEIAIALDAWIDEEDKRLSRPETTQFVWTNLAMEIKSVAEFALDYRKVSMVYSPDSSGMGKTTTFREIVGILGSRRCSLITIDEVCGSAAGLLRKLCETFGVNPQGSPDVRFQAIVEKIKGRSHLLIIDQIQNLRFCKNDRPFYILADLYDASGGAQLWAERLICWPTSNASKERPPTNRSHRFAAAFRRTSI